MDFLDEFGVKPVLLAAQIVNFTILFLLLKKFLYKPITSILEERKRRIEESLKNADEIEKRLANIEEDRKKKMDQAAKDARAVIEEATLGANKIIAEAHLKAEEDIQKMLAKSQTDIRLEREKMHQEIRSELAELVALGMEKVAGKILSSKDKKELTEKSLKGFES